MTWYNVLNNQGFTGTISTPASAGGILQNGWIDVTGGVWTISSGLAASATVAANSSLGPFNFGSLIRPVTESLQDQQIQINFTVPYAGYNQGIFCLLRHNGVSGSPSCYACTYAGNALVLYAVVNGVLGSPLNPNPTAANPEVGASLSGAAAGATFSLYFSAAGVNPTTLYAFIKDQYGNTVATTPNPASSTTFITDSTPALQVTTSQISSGATSVMGMAIYNGSNVATISSVSTYTDIPVTATSFTIYGPNAAIISKVAGPFTITPNGAVTAATTFSLSDSNNGGSFTNAAGATVTTLTLPSGSNAAVTFNYTPAAAGNLTISATASPTLTCSSGNVALNSISQVAWYPVHSTTFSGTVPAVSAGSALQDNWYDITGNIWSISSGSLRSAYAYASGNNYSTVTYGALLRYASPEQAINGRVIASFVYNGSTQSQPYLVVRHNAQFTSSSTIGPSVSSSQVTNCYALTFAGTNMKFYAFVNGSPSPVGPMGATYSLQNNTTYTLEFDVSQNTGPTSGTQLIGTLYSGNVVTTLYAGGSAASSIIQSNTVASDTTSALQNYKGYLGLASFQSSSNISLYTTAATMTTIAPVATAFTLTGPSSASAGVTTSIATPFLLVSNGVMPNNDTSVTVTLSDGGAGGTFATLTGSTITTITTTAGNATNYSFTYTPVAAGTVTISATNNGSPVLLTSPSALTLMVNTGPTTLGVTSAAVQFSPGNWYGDGGGTPSRTGSVWRQSWNNGAWVKFCWTTGSSNPTATLLCGTATPNAANYPNYLTYFLNGAQTDNIVYGGNIAITPSLTTSLVPNTTYTLQVYLRNSWQGGRWSTTGTGVVQIRGLQIDGGASPGAAPSGRPWGMIIGDSITEGISTEPSQDTYGNTDNHLYDYSYFVAQAMDRLGFDTCISACGFSGFIVPGDGYPPWSSTSTTSSDVPPYYNLSGSTYTSSGSRWRYIASGVSLLDSASQISAYGATGTTPSFILINYGTNECIQGASTTDYGNAITACLAALRQAAPQAVIMLLVPFGFYATGLGSTANNYYKALNNAYTAYHNSNPGDGLTSLLDLGPSVCQTVFSNLLWSASPHPRLLGHAYLAPRVAGALSAAMKLTPPTFRPSSFIRL